MRVSPGRGTRVRTDTSIPSRRDAPAARRRVARLAHVAWLLIGLYACDAVGDAAGDGDPDGLLDQEGGGSLASDVPIPRLSSGAIDTSGGPWRLIDVPAAGNQPVIVRSPLGLLALSRRVLGDPRALTAHESALYRSDDGVHWERMALEPEDDQLSLRGLAFGNGRIVVSGRRNGGVGVFRSSADGVDWVETEQGVDGTQIVNDVTFVGGRFFAFGFNVIAVSDDGIDWKRIAVDLVQPNDVAFGAGRFVLVGSGPMLVSQDGEHFEAHDLPCSLPGACVTDPSGGVGQGVQSHVVFAEGRFFSDQISSRDGVTWDAEPGRSPVGFASGLLIGSPGYAPEVWAPDDAATTSLTAVRTVPESIIEGSRDIRSVGVAPGDGPLPDEVDLSFEDGLDCHGAACVIAAGRLYLIPPPETPPLPDHVPRDALGEPLLSDACPTASMVFCEDYAAREGCRCDETAPRRPAYCEDVSMFACEGVLEARGQEWDVPELGPAGCDCGAVDPNQPVSFGLSCEGDPGVCVAPLACMETDAPPSFGPPTSRPRECTVACETDADCPSWEATGLCAGTVVLRCSQGSCQPRTCELP